MGDGSDGSALLFYFLLGQVSGTDIDPENGPCVLFSLFDANPVSRGLSAKRRARPAALPSKQVRPAKGEKQRPMLLEPRPQCCRPPPVTAAAGTAWRFRLQLALQGMHAC